MGLSHGEECKENCKQTCNANARQQNRTGEIVFGVDGKIHNIRIVRLLINQIDNILDSLHDAPGFPEGKRQEKSKVSQRQLAAESRQKLYAGGNQKQNACCRQKIGFPAIRRVKRHHRPQNAAIAQQCQKQVQQAYAAFGSGTGRTKCNRFGKSCRRGVGMFFHSAPPSVSDSF